MVNWLPYIWFEHLVTRVQLNALKIFFENSHGHQKQKRSSPGKRSISKGLSGRESRCHNVFSAILIEIKKINVFALQKLIRKENYSSPQKVRKQAERNCYITKTRIIITTREINKKLRKITWSQNFKNRLGCYSRHNLKYFFF